MKTNIYRFLHIVQATLLAGMEGIIPLLIKNWCREERFILAYSIVDSRHYGMYGKMFETEVISIEQFTLFVLLCTVYVRDVADHSSL